jgi:4-hydroxybenzoate polyprenyltransferase
MIAIVQCVVFYLLDLQQDSYLLFSMVLLSSIFIAAGGYVLNNACDIEIDFANGIDSKTQLPPEKTLYYVSAILFALGLIAAFEVAYLTRFAFLFLFIVPIVALVLYAFFFSRYKAVGNIIVSLMVAYTPFVVYIVMFEHYVEDKTEINSGLFLSVFIFLYSFFAFLLNWIREIIKDMEDIEGDQLHGRKSLPITLGLKNAKIVVTLLYLLFAVCFIYVSLVLINSIWVNIVFVAISVVFIGLLIQSTTKKHYAVMSFIIKIMMAIGLISPLIF